MTKKRATHVLTTRVKPVGIAVPQPRREGFGRVMTTARNRKGLERHDSDAVDGLVDGIRRVVGETYRTGDHQH